MLKPLGNQEPQHLHCLLALEVRGAAHHLSIVGTGQEAAGLHNPDFFLYPDLFLQLSFSFSRFFSSIGLGFVFSTDPCVSTRSGSPSSKSLSKFRSSGKRKTHQKKSSGGDSSLNTSTEVEEGNSVVESNLHLF